jgi:hypothetical protein
MSIERVYYCDGPECEGHARTAGAQPPTGFLTVGEGADPERHFCTWDCLMKFAAARPLPEVVPLGGSYS